MEYDMYNYEMLLHDVLIYSAEMVERYLPLLTVSFVEDCK